MSKYPKEVHQFIVDNVEGNYIYDLVNMINKKFNANYTKQQIKSYKKNHKLKCNLPTCKPGVRTKLIPQDIDDFIRDNVKGRSLKDLVELVNTTFNTTFTSGQIKRFNWANKYTNGIDSTFKPGHTSYNKGKKGMYVEGSEVGWLKKGQKPHNTVPVGTERTRTDGYIYVKVAEPNKWRLKHRIVWEESNGPVPKDYILLFLDGNRSHVELDNLSLITRNLLKLLCKHKLISEHAEVTKTGIIIAKTIELKQQKAKKRKNSNKESEKGKL